MQKPKIVQSYEFGPVIRLDMDAEYIDIWFKKMADTRSFVEGMMGCFDENVSRLVHKTQSDIIEQTSAPLGYECADGSQTGEVEWWGCLVNQRRAHPDVVGLNATLLVEADYTEQYDGSYHCSVPAVYADEVLTALKDMPHVTEAVREHYHL